MLDINFENIINQLQFYHFKLIGMYSNNKKIVQRSIFSATFVFFVYGINYYFEYSEKLKNSEELIDFMLNKNESFLKGKKKKIYQDIQNLYFEKETNSFKTLEKLAKKDHFMFIHLLYLAKSFSNQQLNQELLQGYFAPNHPWYYVFLVAKIFNFKEVEDNIEHKSFVKLFLIGKEK